MTELVTSDGVKLHVESTGPADAPVTVLLVHGWTCSAQSWHHQLEGLPRVLGPDAVRVVAYDHRGHGRSDPAPTGTTRIEQLADDVIQVLDEVVGDGPVVYAGHSMGGMTLLEVADRRPDLIGPRIRAAALISTTAGPTTTQPFGLPARLDPAAALIAPRAATLVGARLERSARRRTTRITSAAGTTPSADATATPGTTAAPDPAPTAVADPGASATPRVPGLASLTAVRRAAWLQTASTFVRRRAYAQFLFGKKTDPAEIDIFIDDLARVSGDAFSGYFQSITEHERAHALKLLADIPVEVMHGTRDRLLPPRHANQLVAELPAARLWMYPGAGHMLMQERPRDVTHRLASLARKAAEPQ